MAPRGVPSSRRARPAALAALAAAAGLWAKLDGAFVVPPRATSDPGERPADAVADAGGPGRRGLLALALPALGGWAGGLSTPEEAEALFLGDEKPKEVYSLKFDLEGEEGGQGEVKIRLHPEWAPRAVKRFKELSRIGEYEDAAVYHVTDQGAAFGLPADPVLPPSAIKDDLRKQQNRRGMVSFVQEGANSRVSELFINTQHNVQHDHDGYAPFAEVIEGMDVVERFYNGYGSEPRKDEIHSKGNKYLDSEFPKLSKMKVLEQLDA